MDFNTKFNHGDEAYYLTYRYKSDTAHVDCLLCECTGKIKLKNIEYTCPECKGNTKRINEHIEWYISGSGKVGKIEVQSYAPKYEKHNESRINYMLDTTGVGSGSVHREDELFATSEEAQKECDRRTEIQYKLELVGLQ